MVITTIATMILLMILIHMNLKIVNILAMMKNPAKNPVIISAALIKRNQNVVIEANFKHKVVIYKMYANNILLNIKKSYSQFEPIFYQHFFIKIDYIYKNYKYKCYNMMIVYITF